MAVLLKAMWKMKCEVELQASNLGFMGIPLVNSIFGSEGVFYVRLPLPYLIFLYGPMV